MKRLAGLRAPEGWVAHLACLYAGAEFLGIPVSRAWLYGGTGHALVINMHETACPSGPTAWNTRMVYELAGNLGLRVEGVSVWRSQAGEAFRQRQREAFEFVRAAIDAGRPCYGWQLEVPDYYVICGYDEVGYYYSGCGCEGKGPLPWEKLATWDVELLEVRSVAAGSAAAPEQVVKEALAAALWHAEGHACVNAAYRAGPAAFAGWAAAVEGGTASHLGHAYNAAAWHECRALAVEFLREVKARLPGRCDGALDEAIGHYAVVRDQLAAVAARHPMQPEGDWKATVASAEAAAELRAAGEAERCGVECLRRIVGGM